MLEHVHEGETEHSVAFVAHLDHPGMANDDLAGCAVGIEVFKRLASHRTKFTYRLLLVQEIIGSVYWWARTNQGNNARIFDSLFLEMLGSETELALQSSLRGHSELEEAVATALTAQGQPHRRGTFGTIVVNDEYVWESYGIPMPSLSRFPYPEYHTDRDNAGIISEEALEAAIGVVVDAIDRLEATTIVRRTFEGTVCLSNPRYGLYVDPGQPAFGEIASEDVKRLRILADTIPTLEHPTSVRAIAARTGVEESVALEYLRRWASHDLIELL